MKHRAPKDRVMLRISIGLCLCFVPAIVFAVIGLLVDWPNAQRTEIQAGLYAIGISVVLLLIGFVAAAMSTDAKRAVAFACLIVGSANAGYLTLAAIPWVSSGHSSVGAGSTPTILIDQAAYFRIHHSFYNFASPGDLSGGRIRHWLFDEYGLVEPESVRFVHRPPLGWEAFGIPFRGLLAPYGIEAPRTYARHRFTEVLVSIRVLPIQIAASILVWTLAILIIVKAPAILRLLTWLRRARAGRCVQCGYALLSAQNICSECGRAVRPIDRMFLGADSGDMEQAR